MSIDQAAPLLRPQECKIVDGDGKERTYIISKIPAMTAREIIIQYPTSAMPKIGDYAVNEQMALKIMAYVGIPMKEKAAPLRLTTRELVNNHVPDARTQFQLERKMAEYNWGFFLTDDLSNFGVWLKGIIRVFLTQILTDSLVQSSQKNKQL